jgi:hypothetical protein
MPVILQAFRYQSSEINHSEPEEERRRCDHLREHRRVGAGPQGMAAAFRSGILVLLAAPFSLVGVIAVLVVKKLKFRAGGAAPLSAEYRA